MKLSGTMGNEHLFFQDISAVSMTLSCFMQKANEQSLRKSRALGPAKSFWRIDMM